MGESGEKGWFVGRAWAHEWRHKNRNGWYLGMVVPTPSILGLLILYSKNVVGL